MADFLDLTSDGSPFAELWFGAHPTGPSVVDLPDGPQQLDAAMERDKTRYLGSKIESQFGRLPYLVKLLAPARPLSLQVHPNNEMASAGFTAEEEQGLPMEDPRRSFKDKHNKPEMVYAITEFEGLLGFRPTAEIRLILDAVANPLPSASGLEPHNASEATMRGILEQILQLTPDEVGVVCRTAQELAAGHPSAIVRAACTTVVELAGTYPGDVGAVVSLVMNRVRLKPGQLVFLADGVPHAYLSGLGLEIMANSDNVLRLGLTSKFVDTPTMLAALHFAANQPDVETAAADAVTHVFRPPVPEFALSITRPHLASHGQAVLPGDGPRILVCLDGTVSAATTASPEARNMTRGQSLFIPSDGGTVTVTGAGTLAQAFVPDGMQGLLPPGGKPNLDARPHPPQTQL